jgi:hypothetical protein
MQLKDFTPQAPNARWGAHIMLWFDNVGGGGHMSPGYQSFDPAVVFHQAELMQRLGISWVNGDWYGNEATTYKAGRLWLTECERRNMEFSVCMDGKSKDSTANMIADLTALAWAFKSPAYKHDQNGKLQVSEFDAKGVDWNAVQAQFPDISFLHIHKQFAWVEASEGLNAISTLRSVNKSIGANGWQAAFPGFHDNNWGNGPERFVDYRNGQTWLDTCATVTADCRDVFLVTWNDYDERSGMERNLDEAMNTPPSICAWPPPIGGKYLWPLPMGTVLSAASGILGGSVSTPTTPTTPTPPTTTVPDPNAAVATWVTAIYQKYLGRNPEAGVVTSVVQRGVTQAQFDAEIAASTEAKQYAATHSTTTPPVVTPPTPTPTPTPTPVPVPATGATGTTGTYDDSSLRASIASLSSSVSSMSARIAAIERELANVKAALP